MKKELHKAYIALGLVSFFWGTTYIAARIGTQHMPGLFVAGIRQFLSGLILVGFFLLRGYQLPEWKVLKRISVQGIFLLCISNGLLTWSLEYISWRSCRYHCGFGAFIRCNVYGVAFQMRKDHPLDDCWTGRWLCRSA